MNDRGGVSLYRPRIPRCLAALTNCPLPFPTERFGVSTTPLSLISPMHISPAFILTTISARRSRHASRHCLSSAKWNGGGNERKRKMIGAFFPVPKKGTHGHIFAIVHNGRKKPERRWWRGFGTWRDECKERERSMQCFFWLSKHMHQPLLSSLWLQGSASALTSSSFMTKLPTE